MMRLLFIIISGILLFSPCPASAGPSPSDFEQGKQLFLSGNYLEARQYLDKAFRADPANPDINFHLGRAAFELGDYEGALMAFDRVLIMDPAATRVKLEIARCHLRLGFKEMAKQYFREVLATNPPEPVWKNIENYLAAIEAEDRRHLFTGALTLGVNWDDNVYQSPVADTILGIQLTGPTARPKSDRIYDSTVVFNHVYLFEEPRLSWKTTLTNYNGLYENQQDLDVYYFALGSGPVWKTEAFLWNNNMIVKYIDVEHDRYLGAFGFASALTVPAGLMLLNFGGRLEEKNNYQDPFRDATNYMINFNPVLVAGANRLSANFFKERENSAAKAYAYDRIGWALQYEREFSEDISGFASFGLQKSDYQGVDPFFLATRADTIKEFKAGAAKLLWQSKSSHRNLSSQLVYTHLDSDANIDIYTYRKNVISLSLTMGF
ncbi:MAG: tetratricopeptide repeat protein [Deltaproteobacteria bacterium]|nr:tetratricopeptide repeat protein [Deltaproteobacteria bacterium]